MKQKLHWPDPDDHADQKPRDVSDPHSPVAGGRSHGSRAPDIQELEDMRHDGAGPEELSKKAIEICKRLQHEIRAARHGHYGNSADLELERVDFQNVLDGIWDGRADGVLDEYMEHVRTYGGPRDG